MSGHVGWIEHSGISLEQVGGSLDISAKLAVERGRASVMRSELDQLMTISLLIELAQPSKDVARRLRQSRYTLASLPGHNVFDVDAPQDKERMLLLKGLIPDGMSVSEWIAIKELSHVVAVAGLAHITAAEQIDKSLTTPGPVTCSRSIGGAPVGEISRYALNVLHCSPQEVDITFDSGARFVQVVAGDARNGRGNLSNALSYPLDQVGFALHCSFIDYQEHTVALLNTQRSESNQGHPVRMWHATSGGSHYWGNDQDAVAHLNTSGLPKEIPENTIYSVNY